MPLYEFRCGSCHAQFELLCRDTGAEAAQCPECGGKSLSRLISRFAVTYQLTPCGTRASEARASCASAARSGGCAACDGLP